MSLGLSASWYTGLAADLDGKYATALGHAIESTIDYIKPWPTNQGVTNTPSDWVTRFNTNTPYIRPYYFDMMVPWATAAVPKRDMQITINIAPKEGSLPSGGFPPPDGSGIDTAGITQWHADINAGLWDAAFAAFANMLVSNGLAHTHVRAWHEPAFWNFWYANVDFTGWVAAFNRMIGVFRANGLTGRMGPSFNDTPASLKDLSASNWPGSDCVWYDTYNKDDSSPTKRDAYATAARSKGLLVNLSEVGINTINQFGQPSSDADGVTFFTSIHNWIQTNADIFDGIMFYSGNTAADLFTGSFPNTVAYIRNNMATWEIEAASGGGGTTGTNSASVTGSGSTAHFSGTVASNSLNVTIYRDTYGGTKIADVAPSGGNWSYDLNGETDGAHVYVIAMFDGTVPGQPANVTFGPQTYNLTINSALAATITNRWTAQTATGANGNNLSGLNWSTLSSPPLSTTVAYLVVAIGSGGSTPDIAGFTFDHRADNGTQVALAHYWRPCDGSENGPITISNATLAAPYGLMHAVLMGKEGVDRTTPFDTAGQDSTYSTGPNVTILSITPTKPGVLLIGSAFVVKYGSTVVERWTPPGTVSEVADLFGLEAGAHAKSLEVVEHLQATQSATGSQVTTWDTTYSFGVSSAIGLRPASAVAPTQSLSNFNTTKDLGQVAILIGTVTSGVATVKAFDNGVLQGTATPSASTAVINLNNPQSVGAHTYVVYGYDSGNNQVAGPYSVSVIVLDAPLVVSTSSAVNDVRIQANAVTTVIKIYQSIANGGAFVTSHAVDAALGWDYTNNAAGYVAARDYDATAFDGTHESAKVRFTTSPAPVSVVSIDSLLVNSSNLLTVVWQGGSLQLFDNAGMVLDLSTGQPVPGGLPGLLYTRQLQFGHYKITVYDTVDPTLAAHNLSAEFDVGTYHFVTIGSPGQHLMKAADGHLILLRS